MWYVSVPDSFPGRAMDLLMPQQVDARLASPVWLIESFCGWKNRAVQDGHRGVAFQGKLECRPRVFLFDFSAYDCPLPLLRESDSKAEAGGGGRTPTDGFISPPLHRGAAVAPGDSCAVEL